MVDVTGKAVTFRHAMARCRIVGLNAAQALAQDPEQVETLAAGRVVGIMGAKSTSYLIPLCHPIPLTDIDVEIRPRRLDGGDFRRGRDREPDRRRDGGVDGVRAGGTLGDRRARSTTTPRCGWRT